MNKNNDTKLQEEILRLKKDKNRLLKALEDVWCIK